MRHALGGAMIPPAPLVPPDLDLPIARIAADRERIRVDVLEAVTPVTVNCSIARPAVDTG